MKEITIRLYDYDELSDEAKRKAHESWLSGGHESFGGDEVRDTMGKLEEEFGIEVTRWSYDSCSHDVGSIRFTRYSDDQLALAGDRARAFLWNHFGHLVIQPRRTQYAVSEGGRKGCGCVCSSGGRKDKTRTSKVFFERTYDGTCPLTGTYFDNDALDPLCHFCLGVKWDAELMRRVMVPHDERWRWASTTVEEVIRGCVDALLRSAQGACEWEGSEEHFADWCRSNGVTFEEDGTRRDAA